MDGPASNEVDLSLFEAALRSPPAIDHRASRVRNIQVQPGLSLFTTDLRLTAPALVESQTFPSVCLSVVLNGFAQGRTTALETGFKPAEVWVASTNDRIATHKMILPAHPVCTVELVVTPQWLEYAAPRFGDDPAFEAMQLAMERGTAARRRPLDATLQRIAWAIQHPPAPGMAAALHLESRALDLLALLAAEFSGSRTAPPAKLSAHAFDRIMAVREQIDRTPGTIATIAQLATEFAISPSKLKQDFATAFGVGVGGYIQERRLLLGRELIERHALSISEAAYRSGYAHPANFTAAFRRRFGRPPSAIKRFS